jgi:hypothetical protein
MAVRLVIKTLDNGAHLVAQVDDYDGPIPRVGESIFHPPYDDDGQSNLSLHGTNVMTVHTVIYGIITRPKNGEGYFTKRPVQVVEVWV